MVTAEAKREQIIEAAQPGAAGVGVAAGIDAVEAFGQARQVLVVDADVGEIGRASCRERV